MPRSPIPLTLIHSILKHHNKHLLIVYYLWILPFWVAFLFFDWNWYLDLSIRWGCESFSLLGLLLSLGCSLSGPALLLPFSNVLWKCPTGSSRWSFVNQSFTWSWLSASYGSPDYLEIANKQDKLYHWWPNQYGLNSEIYVLSFLKVNGE